MGQYFNIANNTTKEYLYDHKIGDHIKGFHGIKWGEIAFNRFGSLQLLAILIATDTSFGDRTNLSFTGRWAGHEIGMYGDYTSGKKYEEISQEYKDITDDLMRELLSIPYWKEFLESIT